MHAGGGFGGGLRRRFGTRLLHLAVSLPLGLRWGIARLWRLRARCGFKEIPHGGSQSLAFEGKAFVFPYRDGFVCNNCHHQMHIVNKRKDLDLTEAVKTPNGLAALAFFIEVTIIPSDMQIPHFAHSIMYVLSNRKLGWAVTILYKIILESKIRVLTNSSTNIFTSICINVQK